MSRLNHQDRHFGVYKNSKGQTRSAYIQWRPGRGFLLYSDAGRPILTEGFENVARMKLAGVDFQLVRSKKENTNAEPFPQEQVAA